MTSLTVRNRLYESVLALFGVKAVTWWEGFADSDKSTRGLTIVIHHAWWTWLGLRNRNRARVIILATDSYQEPWAFVEVI